MAKRYSSGPGIMGWLLLAGVYGALALTVIASLLYVLACIAIPVLIVVVILIIIAILLGWIPAPW